MSVKAVLVFCAQALLVQSVFSQCTSRAAVDASGLGGAYAWPGLGLAGPGYGSALAYEGFGAPWAGRGLAYDGIYPSIASSLDFTPTTGGGLSVTSSSAVPPTGISIVSDNAYEGLLSVAGELPFVGTTAMEGQVPSAGAGAINHGCGNGLNTMTALSDRSSPASVATYGLNAPYGIAGSALGGYPGVATPGLAYSPYGAAYPYGGVVDGIEFTATTGGALPVNSGSAVSPTGIAVASETVYEGPLAVAGELPFVGTVGLEGVLPTAGAGVVNHSCGNGVNAMISEGAAFAPGFAGAYAPGFAGISPAAAIAPGFAGAYGSAALAPGFGYPGGWAGRAF